MIPRLSRTVLVAACALHLTIVAYDNLVDYGTNFQFVQHVLSMDTVFPGNRDSLRAITSPAMHHLFYAGIIAWECLTATTLWWGAVRLAKSLRSDAATFRTCADVALAGLTMSLLLWLTFFVTVGGEWFMMWQSTEWNGVQVAARNFGMHAVPLLYLSLPPDRVAGEAG